MHFVSLTVLGIVYISRITTSEHETWNMKTWKRRGGGGKKSTEN